MTKLQSVTTLAPIPSAGRGARPATNDCECGCGGKTGSRFVPGHDSRLRAWMLRIERGQVGKTPATFPGSPGELKSALAHLEAAGGKTPQHVQGAPMRMPVVAAGKSAPKAGTTDKKLAKRQAREAKRAQAETAAAEVAPVEEAAEPITE